MISPKAVPAASKMRSGESHSKCAEYRMERERGASSLNEMDSALSEISRNL